MNLCIDIGNTLTKIAVFQDGKLKYFEAKSDFSVTDLKMIFKKFDVSKTIITSVTGSQTRWVSWLKKNKQVLVLGSTTKLPIKILYKSKSTLGTDRIAACVGAQSIFQNKNILVLNAGTCLTIDFVNSKNEYLGGSISPGLHMRLNAMHHFTSRLPQIKKIESAPIIGTTTLESMSSGALHGMVHEINGWINLYENQFGNVHTVLSGGDGGLLAQHIKRPIFADPYLVLRGLNKTIELH